jgi:hypothetical protein
MTNNTEHNAIKHFDSQKQQSITPQRFYTLNDYTDYLIIPILSVVIELTIQLDIIITE